MAIQFPDNPPLDFTYEAPTGIIYQWDGEKWTTQFSLGQNLGANPGPNPPSDPAHGDFWYDTTTSTLYARYDDGVLPPEWLITSLPSPVNLPPLPTP